MARGSKKPEDSESSGMTAAGFEEAIAAHPTERFVLRLYITGMTARSQRAVESLKALCDQHLSGRYDLEIIDIYQQPMLAKDEQIIAAPTLVKKLPLPLRRVIGDLSDPGRILAVIGFVLPAGGPHANQRP